MFQPVSRKRGATWGAACLLAQLLLLFLAPRALAEAQVVDPQTGLSLDFDVKGALTCIVIPEKLYVPQDCEGIPPRDPATLPDTDKGLHVLAVVRQGEATILLTVSSISRPGIGQMSEQQIRGFLEGTVTRLASEFGGKPRLLGSGDQPYTLKWVGEVPVVRWEYATEVPEAEQQANVSSGVVYLVPSKDTLDIISLNTHERHLEVARGVGEELVSKLKVPLTIDAGGFGGSSLMEASPVLLSAMAAGVFLVLVAGGVWLWRRRRRE